MATPKTTQKTAGVYIQSVGRRKTAVARARLTPSTRTSVNINGRELENYFSTEALRTTAMQPILKLTIPTQFTVTIVVSGGGITGQAEAIRHAIARALNEHDPALRGELKKEGFLKRDPRAVERKKPGLVKARKRKQWSKR